MSKALKDWRGRPIVPGVTVLYRSASKNAPSWKIGEVTAVRLDRWGDTVLDIDWHESSKTAVSERGNGVAVGNVMVWEGA